MHDVLRRGQAVARRPASEAAPVAARSGPQRLLPLGASPRLAAQRRQLDRLQPVAQREPAETETEAEPEAAETSEVDAAIAELLSCATEEELDALIQNDPMAAEASAEDAAPQAVAPAQAVAQHVKVKPKHLDGYTTATHGGRTYYHRPDGVGKRTRKIAGPIVYTKAPRVGTPKVAYKRKNDAAGHLIAHSFGGPPTFVGNFVAMNKAVNGAGGDWGKMEAYIRKRLKARFTAAWMSVRPHYKDNKTQRPHQITVTVHFNREPKWKRFIISTP